MVDGLQSFVGWMGFFFAIKKVVVFFLKHIDCKLINFQNFVRNLISSSTPSFFFESYLKTKGIVLAWKPFLFQYSLRLWNTFASRSLSFPEFKLKSKTSFIKNRGFSPLFYSFDPPRVSLKDFFLATGQKTNWSVFSWSY